MSISKLCVNAARSQDYKKNLCSTEHEISIAHKK